MYMQFSTSQLPIDVKESYSLSGRHIEITSQPTGFGSKRLFICPTCGARRAKLIIYEHDVFCRSCTPFNIYKRRCNLYDEGGTDLIEWHMAKIARAANIPLKFPFKYYDYPDYLIRLTPKKHEALRMTLAKLQMLENMRFSVIFFHCSFTAKQIKEYISPAFISQFNLWQIEYYCIFTGHYSPHEARGMMRDSPDWMNKSSP